MKNVLVLNMGMKSIRAIIFLENGEKLGSYALPIVTAIDDKRVEQDPNEWWDKAQIVIGTAIKNARVRHVDFITVTTSASSLVCLDSDGGVLRPAIMVSDKRAEDESREINGWEEFRSVLETTSLPCASSLMLPKILWIKKHEPEAFEKTVFFVSSNDFLIYRLTGKIVTDYLNGLKFHYILSRRKEPDGITNGLYGTGYIGDYPKVLLDKIGISESSLPEVVNTGSDIGTITGQTAESTKLSTDCRVIVTSYDAICSFFGSGVSEDNEASDVSGTVTVFRALYSGNIPKRDDLKIYVTPYISENTNIVGGSNNLGGGLIEWAKQCYYMHEDYPYEVMEKEAGESEVGSRGLIFLPYLLGERAPLWDDDARGVFFGLERMHTRKDMTRAIFESTGFIDCNMLEAIGETGVHVKSVRLSGGLARLNLVSQIKADILGIDVKVLQEFETTSTGAAIMALVGAGVYKNIGEAAPYFAHIRMIIKPDMNNHEKYKKIYELYKSTYEALQPQFAKRMELVKELGRMREVQIENL
ncbi:MAG: hypothetical protein K6E62_01885 [Lachnospiraceae bacterium]|nr:hypothetical protein [Lachnospiraceae bacterium]